MGQSSFRCDLAVRKDGESKYRLGILVDTPAYYQQSDALEREVLRPKLLRAFGWSVSHVLTKDWLESPEKVVAELTSILDGRVRSD